jgi:hypothetical protein
MISVGTEYLMESVTYYEHIGVLRSFGTVTDQNNYMYDLGENNNHVTITILNGDGDSDKADFLKYLIEEWLTLSNYWVTEIAHLPLEMEMGLFKHERIV